MKKEDMPEDKDMFFFPTDMWFPFQVKNRDIAKLSPEILNCEPREV